MMKLKKNIDPPYTNRWGCVPGADYIRCSGITKIGKQCRACAVKGEKYCILHNKVMDDA